MSLLNALILGLIRGIAGVIPVSWTGHAALAGRLMDIDISADPLFITVLGAGTLAAAAVVFHREIVRVLVSLGGIVIDLVLNLLILIQGKNIGYRRILTSAYRKITVMLLISLIPSVIITSLFGSLAQRLSGSLLAASVGMLLTAMILAAASFATRFRKGPKETDLFAPVVTGVLYGFSVFPGVSEVSMAVSGGFINEFTRRFAVKYTFLLYFFAGLITTGSGLAKGPYNPGSASAPAYILGTAVSAVSAYLILKLFCRRLSAAGSRKFAVYSACIGVVSLIMYFALRG